MRALILRGDGFSSHTLDAFQRRFPDHEIWSMNSCYIEGASRHFDIHYYHSQHGNKQACSRAREAGAEVILSPFAFSPEARPLACKPDGLEGGPNGTAFPLREIFALFGTALYQRTLCYMLAFAALEHRLGRLAFDVLCLPGHDYISWPHFAMRDGPTFWLGVLRGIGVGGIECAPGSSLTRRHLEPWMHPGAANAAPDLLSDQPHLYGQPRTLTAPLTKFFRWE